MIAGAQEPFAAMVDSSPVLTNIILVRLFFMSQFAIINWLISLWTILFLTCDLHHEIISVFYNYIMWFSFYK